MSKSLGNILTIKEILKDWHPEVLRLFFLSYHYRSPVDYSEDSLHEAKLGLDRFYTTMHSIQEELKKPLSQKKLDSPVIENCRHTINSFPARFEEAMDEDFNTAEALGHFYDLQRNLNSILDISKGHPSQEIVLMIEQGLDYFSKIGWVFGVFQEDPGDYLGRQKKEGLKKLNLTEEQILYAIEERNLTRKEKNYKRADEIRNDLLSKGIVLEDTPTGTTWKIK
jgi:cysteinyl-tRNA synthetase